MSFLNLNDLIGKPKAKTLRYKNMGQTLAELLLAVFILSIGIISTLSFFSNALITTDYARDLTTATTHAEYILEEMQTRPSLFDLIHTDWAKLAQQEGFDMLPEENFDIAFLDPASDPLDIQVTVSWTKKMRKNNVILKTALTK